MNEKRAKMLRRVAYASSAKMGDERKFYQKLKRMVIPRSPYFVQRNAYMAELNLKRLEEKWARTGINLAEVGA